MDLITQAISAVEISGIIQESQVSSKESCLCGATTSQAITNCNVSLELCLDQAKIEYYVPPNPSFATTALAYNLRLNPQPVAIVYSTSSAQVSAAVACASRCQVPVTCRSGGHSYAASGLGGTDGKLVIDLSKLNSFSFNNETKIATVGAGIRLGDLALNLHSNGRAMPHGTCPTVGLGGHASFGGYGFYSRLWGLTLDRVIGHEVVLADSSIVRTSATDNSDLFWALRGAAPSFGIITSYILTTEPIPAQNVQLLITWDLDAKAAADAFVRFQENLPKAPIELGYAFRMFKGQTESTLRVDFIGHFMGTVEALDRFLGPQISILPAPVTRIMEPIAWIPLLEWLADSPLDAPAIRDTFYAKSLTVYEDSPMTPEQALSFTTYLATTPTPLSWFAMADNWGGSSMINSVPLDATSFSSRSNLFGWQLYANTIDGKPPFPADGIPFVQGMWDAIVKPAPVGWRYGSYINYIDSELSADEAHRLYFGPHYPRLQAIKKVVDPHNVFSYPHGIQPAK